MQIWISIPSISVKIDAMSENTKGRRSTYHDKPNQGSLCIFLGHQARCHMGLQCRLLYTPLGLELPRHCSGRDHQGTSEGQCTESNILAKTVDIFKLYPYPSDFELDLSKFLKRIRINGTAMALPQRCHSIGCRCTTRSLNHFIGPRTTT